MSEKPNMYLSKRTFLFQSGKSLALLASANVAVYAIGSAFKNLDGSLVAGAKLCSCWCNDEIIGICGGSPPYDISGDCVAVHPTSCSALNGTCSGHRERTGCAP